MNKPKLAYGIVNIKFYGTSKKSLLYSGDDIFCQFKAPKTQFRWAK